MIINNQNPYPTFWLPGIVRSAALEVERNVQVTGIIAATSCLTGVSTSVSPLADWKHPLSGQERPCNLNQGIIAKTGDRKSAAEMLACRAIFEHDADAIWHHERALNVYGKAKLRWAAVRKRLLSRYVKEALEGKEAGGELAAFEAKEPLKPISHRIIYENVNQVSLLEALEGDGRAMALLTDEGQTLLSSTVMRHYGLLNSIWDGKPLLTRDRAQGDNIIVQNPRATISFMIQPDILAEFFEKRGKAVQQSGFCARFLFSRSPTLQGCRPPKLSSPLVDLPPFHLRMRDLLARYRTMVDAGRVARDVLEFDDEAKQVWLQLAGQVESQFHPGFFLSDISDFGNKYMDIVGRLACLFHYFELDVVALPDDPEARAASIGKMSATTLSAASQVASWHLNEYKEMFAPPLQRTPEEHDADKVYGYLHRSFYLAGTLEVTKNHVLQYCGVRRGIRFDNALRVLESWQAIWVTRKKLGESKKETAVIVLNPQYFNSRALY